MPHPIVRTAPLALVAGLVAVGLLAGTALATPTRQTLTGQLSSASAVPVVGPLDGTGVASLAVDRDRKRICTSLWVTGVEAPTGADISLGAPGAVGSVVVTLEAPTTGAIQNSCVNDVDKDLLKAMIDAPSDYYVTVYSAAYPGGAVRGQLIGNKG